MINLGFKHKSAPAERVARAYLAKQIIDEKSKNTKIRLDKDNKPKKLFGHTKFLRG